MKRIEKYIRTLQSYLLVTVVSFGAFLTSCIDEPQHSNTPIGNFEALWQIIDQRYCYLDAKQIDWDSIKSVYQEKLRPYMNNYDLFDVLNQMLCELKDGHVNLYATHDVGRYWKWFEDYPENFNQRIVFENYLHFDYKIASGMRYKKINRRVGYIYYGSFSSNISPGGLDQILAYLLECDAIIIDVRSNGGGGLNNVDEFVSRFIQKPLLAGYVRHKTGFGHSDFSAYYPNIINPSNRIRYQGQVILLTNRGCYSATNNFVSAMRELSHVTQIGDVTGGGGGLPFSADLPNGWSVRFSAAPAYDSKKNNIEFGVAPQIIQMMDSATISHGRDAILDRALSLFPLN